MATSETVEDILGSNIPPLPKKRSPRRPQQAAMVEKKEPIGVKRNTIRIILEDNENIPPTGQFFGFNGRGYIIRPGEEVDVPPGIVDILNNAETSVAIVDPRSGKVVGHRKRMRFPYRLLSQAA